MLVTDGSLDSLVSAKWLNAHLNVSSIVCGLDHSVLQLTRVLIVPCTHCMCECGCEWKCMHLCPQYTSTALWAITGAPAREAHVRSPRLHPNLEIIKGCEKGNTFSAGGKMHPLSQDMFWCTSIVDRGPQKMCTKGWMSDCAAGPECWLQDGPAEQIAERTGKKGCWNPCTEHTLSWKPIKQSDERAMAKRSSWFKQAWHLCFCDNA